MADFVLLYRKQFFEFISWMSQTNFQEWFFRILNSEMKRALIKFSLIFVNCESKVKKNHRICIKINKKLFVFVQKEWIYYVYANEL